MTIYASKTLKGFFNDETHGPKLMEVPDPNWVRPTIEVEGQMVPDDQAVWPKVEIQNPRLPTDALEINAALHAELLGAPFGIDWDVSPPQPLGPPGFDPDRAAAEFLAKGQSYLDDLAQSWGYDSIFTAVTYADEPAVPRFQAEGIALRRYRSEFWEAANALTLAEGATVESLLAQLPEPPTRPSI